MRIWRGLAVLATLAALAMPASAQRRQVTPEERRETEAALARFTSPTLTRFGSEGEFRRYIAAMRAAQRARYGWASAQGWILLAQAPGPAGTQSDAGQEPLCPPENPNCAETVLRELPGARGSIVVTGTSASPSNPSITNNQMRGVEEGDIVKQIGHHLLVLQDGRIFVVDIRPGGRRGLRLTDRINVYRDSDDDIWYDEMLVFGDRVLITGYSYGEDASELSVFRLSPDGRLSREGVYYISSDDYYSSSNYATRLIGDNLIIYTPFSIDAIMQDRFKWPVVRRWVNDEEREEALRRGRPLFDAGNIYRPVVDLTEATVHSVSVCPLGRAGAGSDLECRTTAFVAPNDAQWYVTNDDVLVWTGEEGAYGRRDRDECRPDQALAAANAAAGYVYRIGTSGGSAPTVAAARGMPIDQFSMQTHDGRFRALLRWRPRHCYEGWSDPARLTFFDVPLGVFGSTLEEVAVDRYTPMPGVGTGWVANRFTDHYLVYGGLSRYRSGLPEFDDEATDEESLRYRRRALAMPPAYVVPVARPRDVRPLGVRHTVIRAERVADDIVLTGYRDHGGLRVTLIDLDGRPRIAGSIRLDGRFESEGRSHAFNSIVEPDGSGMLGLPTVPRITESDRDHSRSRASDLSYLALDRDGGLFRLGELLSRVRYDDEDEDGVPGYECEVSCIDWYGNSRPIFTDGRIFALTGAELVEGAASAGRIRELRRLNLTTPPPR